LILVFEVRHFSHPNAYNLESSHILFIIDGYVINGVKICIVIISEKETHMNFILFFKKKHMKFITWFLKNQNRSKLFYVCL